MIPDQTHSTGPQKPVVEDVLHIRPAHDGDKSDWDRFVFETEGGTFFHRFDWRALFRDVFGLAPQYLIAERGRAIVGVLPLVHQKSILFGNAMMSLPFCVEGGPLAPDAQVRSELDAAAIELTRETKASSLEFRSRHAQRPGWAVKSDLYATFSREIFSEDEKNLLAIPRKQRAVVRKTLDSGLVSDIDSSIDAFFRVYAESVRNLGTPMFPKKYFRALLDAFGRDCNIVVVRDEGIPVSAVMNFYFKETVLPYYGGGTHSARKNGANDFLYWEVMRRAAEQDYRRFDFGRSKAGTGAFKFKKNWGFDPEWLAYEYWLPEDGEIPSKNPTNPLYARLSEIWKILPLPIANFIGPFLISGLG